MKIPLHPLLVLVLALAANSLLAQTSWFGSSYRDYADFTIMGRNLETFLDQQSPRRYVMLLTGAASLIENPAPVKLPDDQLKAAVHRALQRQGFIPAASKEEAELAIVVAYGRGEYQPPFAFAGVDPTVIPFHFWPRALKEYDQAYSRRDYHDVELTQGIVERAAPSDADRVNFIAIRAFDAALLRTEKRWVLRWETRVTTGALDRPLENVYTAMIVAATGSLGSNARRGIQKTAPFRNGVVEIGALETVEVLPTPEPPTREELEPGASGVVAP
jgi:hypothetical protein